MRSTHLAVTAVIAAVVAAALIPGCTLIGPCSKDSFKLFPRLNRGFPLATRGIPIFIDPCPLLPTDCGDGPPIPLLVSLCGLDSTTECACFNDFLTAPRAAAASTRAVAFSYDGVTNVIFGLGTSASGLSPSVQLRFDVTTDQLQTFHGVVSLPDAFAFNGFTALGPADTQIGVYALDLDLDDVVDLALPVRARDVDHAYVDLDRDGAFDLGLDGTIEHTTGAGLHVFTIDLPLGGDGNARLFFGPLALRALVALYAGILTNGVPGPYDFTASFTSVDPSSGGADDGTGAAPMSLVPTPLQLVVEPSQLTVLDPFLCYKAKPSKGNICAATAAMNAGAACASDADCGGTGGACVKNVPPKGIRPLLADGFETKASELVKPLTLCAPAGPDGMVVADEITHFRGYRIKNAKTSCALNAAQNPGHACTTSADCGGGACAKTPKHAPARLVRVVNALGTLVVDTTKPDSLLVPTTKNLAAPAAPFPGPPGHDHFKCYTVKPRKKICAEDPERTCKHDLDCDIDGPCLTKLPKGLEVTVQDQFTGAPKTFVVKKATRLCLAADKNDEGVQNDEQNLACYQVKAARSAAPHVKRLGIHLTNQFGRERIDTITEAEICLPSLRLR